MKKTSYQFAVETNTEALDAMERLSVGARCFLPDNGNIILEAKEILDNPDFILYNINELSHHLLWVNSNMDIYTTGNLRMLAKH